MPLAVSLAGFSIFLAALLVHICWWRVKKPADETGALLAIFLVLTVFAGIGLRAVKFSGMEVFAACLLHWSLACVYRVLYPAVQAYSPSLRILLLLGGPPSKTLSREEIWRGLESATIVSDKFKDLIGSNLVSEKDGRYALTAMALLIVRFYAAFARFLGIPTKGI